MVAHNNHQLGCLCRCAKGLGEVQGGYGEVATPRVYKL